MARSGKRTFCCGAGGAHMWMEERGSAINEERVREAVGTGAETLAVACPFCTMMLDDGVKQTGAGLRVADVSVLLAEALGSQAPTRPIDGPVVHDLDSYGGTAVPPYEPGHPVHRPRRAGAGARPRDGRAAYRRRLSTRLGLPKSTASRLVGALERQGLIQRDGGAGRLVPGAVLQRFARRETGDAELVDVAAEALDRLAQASGETVNLGVPSLAAVELLDQRDSRHFLGSTNWVGRRVPAHGSALGKVVLRVRRAPGADWPARAARPSHELGGRRARARRGAGTWLRDGGGGAGARPLGGRGARPRRVGRRRSQRSASRGRPFDSGAGCFTSSDVSPGRSRVPSRPSSVTTTGSEVSHERPTEGWQMSTEEIDLGSLSDEDLVKQMHDDLYDGLAPEIVEGTELLLERGWSAEKTLAEALVEGMRIVGIDFRDGILFVPEVLLAANAMKAGMEVLRPLLSESDADRMGKVVIGTVKGDIHDIGKNLVAMMLEGAGFEVIDLGINNPVENYLAALEEHKPEILGMSALLTTTMPYMKVVIDTLNEQGLRNDVIVLVGGAPLNEEFGKAIGADAYCRDAAVAAETAQALVLARRSSVTAS